MKGFIRILESIIASVIILTALTFFFSTPARPTNWDDSLLQIRSEDIIASLARNGTLLEAVRTNSPDLINNIVSNQNLSAMPFTIDYSLEIYGIPNPIIYIGCVCTQDEVDNLTDRLSPLTFLYKNRTIEIRIATDSLTSIRNETNILFMFGYKNLTSSMPQINKFLGRGGTLFMLGDLTEDNVNDGIMNETFGLSWITSPRPPGLPNVFFEPENENMTTFKIAKYFRNISSAPESFSFLEWASIAVDNRTIVFGRAGINQWSTVKINKEIINGDGRTVWFSTYAQSNSTKALLKSVVMWASGERFKLDLKPKKILPHNVKARLFVFDNDVYEAVLTLWRVFQ